MEDEFARIGLTITPSRSKMFTIYTDGGARNNGKRSCTCAWAVYVADDSPLNESGRIVVDPSNQKAELYAIRMALTKMAAESTKIAADFEHDTIETVRIVTDSQYSIDAITKWCKNWERNGWRTYKGEPVKHSKIIKDCLALKRGLEQRGLQVDFCHVNSHMLPPKDKDSPEYVLWYGNYKADKMVSSALEDKRNSDAKLAIPKGKVVSINWDGTVLDENVRESKSKRSSTSAESVVEVTW